MKRPIALAVLVGSSWWLASATQAQFPVDALDQPPKWQAPSGDALYSEVLAWAVKQQLDPEIDAQIAQLWNETNTEPPGPVVRLERLAQTFALVDARARELVERCSQPRRQIVAPPEEWLSDESMPALVRHNLRLLYGRWLVQESLYDEALEHLAILQPDEVADPASLLFYQSVVYHRLLKKDEGLKSINQLLDDVADPPARYVAVAELMREDLEFLEEGSLDHISRRMDDIRRRLTLGSAGKKVRSIEDGVIESLDKLIEELENQQQQQQQQAGGGSNRSNRPADDSRILAGRGPGDVNRRNLDRRGGWGTLPPKERELALQQIGNAFPSHYRDVIQQYFRRLASEQANDRGQR